MRSLIDRLDELIAVQRRQAVALENLSGTLMVAGKRVSAIEDNLNDLASCVDKDCDFRVTVNGNVRTITEVTQ
jgi:hypothetical protein